VLRNGAICNGLAEADVPIEARRCHYDTGRPYSGLGYRPPAPEAATLPVPLRSPPTGNGGRGDNAPTIYPDHPVGGCSFPVAVLIPSVAFGIANVIIWYDQEC